VPERKSNNSENSNYFTIGIPNPFFDETVAI
jgi:hypothetical protein